MLGLGQGQGLGHGQAQAQGQGQGHRASGQDDPFTPSRKARWRIIFDESYIGFIVVLGFQGLFRKSGFFNAFSNQHGSVFDAKNRRTTDKW